METKRNINVGGLDFKWDLDSGRFMFEEEDSVVFWISTAMKSFFDTIEEISGEEASCLVFETTGYRQGVGVGGYFREMKDVSVEEASALISNTYASAGWGQTIIENLNRESKTLTAKFKNSWEHKINVAQGKKAGSNFIPAHFAGIFSTMFNTNMWYKVIHYQLEGYEYTEVAYFESDVTVNSNIHQLSRKKESDAILQLEALVEDKTRDLTELIKEISSPIIPVHEGVVVVPLIGRYDEDRAEALVERVLTNLPSYKVKYLILDLTGLHKEISHYTASLMEKIVSTARLIGTETVLVGISPQLSIAIIQSDVDLSAIDCFQTLQHGIHYSLGQLGRRII